MPTTKLTSRLRRSRKSAIIVLAFVSAFSGIAATGCESLDTERTEVISRINETRISQGLQPLRSNVVLSLKADRWARQLRDLCDLKHSKLSDGAPKQWLKLGENVGYGGSIGIVHDAYLNSPGHRANILDPEFNQVGAAAVWGQCEGQTRVFTVQVFMKA